MNTTHRAMDDHFQAWMHQVNEACGLFDARRLDEHFDGRLERHQAGLISLSIVDMTQVNLFRGPREIRASGADNYYAVLQMAGTARIEQHDNRLELSPGDLTLIDASQPLDMHFHERSRQLSLILPRPQVESSARGLPIQCARRICAKTPLASLANSVMTGVSHMDNLGIQESQAILDAVVNLLRPAITEESRPGSHERLFRKALALIDQHIASEELCPESIANEVGISMRSLYRIFAKQGLVVAQYIRNRRLDFCAESLRNPHMELKLSSLGYAWGFSDSSHFSTAFKSRFGVSPGEYRKRHAE